MEKYKGADVLEPGWPPHRIGAFVDAVLAIAITLLAIELERPKHDDVTDAAALADFLWHERSSFVALLVAFFLLWSVWRRHHVLIYQVERVDRYTLAAHAPMLLFATLLPFVTAVFGGATGNPLAVCLFAGVAAALFASEAVVKEIAARKAVLAEQVTADDLRVNADGSYAVATTFAVTAALAWLTPDVWVVWLFAPLGATFGGRVISRVRGLTRS
ncbi:TMEM175 family protein [Nocardia brasiliensis]|uniref:TMEM175 family protein n=1 Tax=Nocardia brasiliensis TaxID=37326 RepID=UPI002456861E|nr:TMEM175 family protein [Nocardia brasiliensis]